MTGLIELRDVVDADVAEFFEHQRDTAANQMAAFSAQDPEDKSAFIDKWTKILADESITKQTILVGAKVAGHVLSFVAPWSGKREVSYWIGAEHWGRGVATEALRQFLNQETVRPLQARVAQDNHGSLRVLAKCGFREIGRERAFANSRGKKIGEIVWELPAANDDSGEGI